MLPGAYACSNFRVLRVQLMFTGATLLPSSPHTLGTEELKNDLEMPFS